MVRQRLTPFVALLFGFLLLPAGFSLAAEVVARVDQSVVAEGEPIRLTLTRSGDQGRLPEPDLSPLEKDFQILGTSSESNIRILNGHSESTVGLTVTLLPRRTGPMTIPALAVAGMKTTPIKIEVTPAGTQGGGSGGGQPGDHAGAYFLESEVDNPTPYVQGQVLLKVRFYRAVTFTRGEIADPVIADAAVERLGEDRAYSAEVKGRSYEVLERTYAIFPQKSGALTLPGLVFQGEAKLPRSRTSRTPDPGGFGPFANDPFFQNFFGRDPFAGVFEPTRPVTLRSDPIQLDVKPRPPAFTGPWWLPAAQLTLTDNGLSDPITAHVGEPLTRILGLHAKGLAATQLPEIPKPRLDGLNIYPDQPVTQSQAKGRWILGEREEKWAILATRPGTYTLPAIEIPWWNVADGRAEVARLPARTLTVLPAADTGTPPPTATAPATQAPATPTPAASPSPSADATGEHPPPGAPHVELAGGYWPWLTAAALLLWLGTLVAWWRQRQRLAAIPTLSTPPSPLPAPRRQPPATAPIAAACATNDPQRIAAALLAWGGERWPEDPPRTLGALQSRLDPTAAPAVIARIERGLYAPNTPWDGGNFWTELQPLLIPATSPAVPPVVENLPALNPDPHHADHRRKERQNRRV
ncbi:MAG: protein BatD [Magnetococcales bacterium]|nr:protein BatD [Magnetococcales bacterium]